MIKPYSRSLVHLLPCECKLQYPPSYTGIYVFRRLINIKSSTLKSTQNSSSSCSCMPIIFWAVLSYPFASFPISETVLGMNPLCLKRKYQEISVIFHFVFYFMFYEVLASTFLIACIYFNSMFWSMGSLMNGPL